METITTIVNALVLGATTGSRSIAEKAVKDAYEALKKIIQKFYERINIQSFEEKPRSEARQNVLIEDLTDAEADKNPEILEKTKILIECIQNLSEEEVSVIGVKLEDIKGLNLNIEDIISSGDGVVIKKAELKEDINIKGINAGINNLDEKPDLNVQIEGSSVGKDFIVSKNIIKNDIKPGLLLNLIIVIISAIILLAWNYPSLKLIKSFINQETTNKDINKENQLSSIRNQDLIELGVLIRNLTSVEAPSWLALRSSSSPINWDTEGIQESPNNTHDYYLLPGNVFVFINNSLDISGYEPATWDVEVYGTRTFVTYVFLSRKTAIPTNVEDFEEEVLKSIENNNQFIITNNFKDKYGRDDGRKISFLIKFSDRNVPGSILYSCGANGSCWIDIRFKITESLRKEEWL